MPYPRRRLRFASLAGVLPEVERLSVMPYRRVGQWNLAQICAHLAGAFELSMNGFGKPAPRGMRALAGKLILRVVLFSHRIPTGRPLAQEHIPPAETDPVEAISRLRAAIGRFAAHTGPLAMHPLFGRMSAEKWTAFHLVHCGHHLSFLVPEEKSV